MRKLLKDIMDGNTFVHGVELATLRGMLQAENAKHEKFGHEIMETDFFDFISITDNPGGHSRIAPEGLGRSLLEKGHNVNIHMTCKDRNRNALEMRAWQLASDGFDNILALTGDYPVSGYQGIARPVFDIDAVGLLKMYSAMNSGITIPSQKMGSQPTRLSKTNFYLSACVNPFKRYEGEYLPQYFKMEKKIQAGARYFILQLGYDSRKWAELLTYAKLRNITTPFIATVYRLNKGIAKLFYDEKIAGCVVSPELFEKVTKEAASPDKGKAFFLDFAAKQWAVAKGLGFKGVYIGGIHKVEEIAKIKEMANKYTGDDWKTLFKELSYPLPGEFYLFNKDKTGLPILEYHDAYVKSKKPLRRFFRIVFAEPPVYQISRLVHMLFFNRKSPLYHLMHLFYRALDGKKPVERTLHILEYLSKAVLFGCHDCGDCSLQEIAYLCPEDRCSKNQRNGPCGGSRKGKCEVDEKKCIWLKAYNRLKPYNEEEESFKGPVVFTDAKWLNTSGWQNYFLGRDHTRDRSLFCATKKGKEV
jgi:methylenetetrahydrofolate reductase (NADPH)